MRTIQLTDAQLAALREVLDVVVRELSYEISNTDKKEYRDHIKERRETLQSVEVALAAAAEEPIVVPL